MSSRTQRYRLVHEFVLQDRGDYEAARAALSLAIEEAWEKFIGVAPDYLSIERVKNDDQST